MIDGFIRNLREALQTQIRGTSLSLLATGSAYPAVAPLLRNRFTHSETLTLLGAAILFAQNRKSI